jgi:hypothetical protein
VPAADRNEGISNCDQRTLQLNPMVCAQERTTHRYPTYQKWSLSETVSVPAIPSARAAPVDKSMQRPFTNGPRSLIRTVTLRPLECEVTVTREPNGLVRCAAVIAFKSIRSPDAVRPPP